MVLAKPVSVLPDVDAWTISLRSWLGLERDLDKVYDLRGPKSTWEGIGRSTHLRNQEQRLRVLRLLWTRRPAL